MLPEDHYDSSVEKESERDIGKAGESNVASSLQNISCPSHQETCQMNLTVSCTWLTRGKYFKCCWNVIVTLFSVKIVMN